MLVNFTLPGDNSHFDNSSTYYDDSAGIWPWKVPVRGAKTVQTILRRVQWRGHLAAFALVAILNPLCRAQNRTLTFDTVDDVDTISFDPTKISEAKLRELMLLSPFVVSYFNDLPRRHFSAAGSTKGDVVDKIFLALPLELCTPNDPAYAHCEENSIGGSNFLHNASVNLERSRRGLERLRHADYPEQLNTVVKFLLDGLAFSLWIEETRFKYYSTWDSNALKEAHDDIDPTQLCSETFHKLQGAQSNEGKYRIVQFDWANCMVGAIDKKLGPYPIGAWNAFLKSNGITEHYQQKGPD